MSDRLQINQANLHFNADGTPVADDFDDVYFSNDDGLAETQYVFIGANRLVQRWKEVGQRRFTVAETGFGSGMNFLACWQAFEDHLIENPHSQCQQLHFISFEKYPIAYEALALCHRQFPSLNHLALQLQAHYPEPVAGCHRLTFKGGKITLDLWLGDVNELLPQNRSNSVDAWFLDGFAPSKNPQMWTENLFQNLFRLAKPGASVATFTAAGLVRRGLADAGFEVKKIPGYGNKRDMTIASKPALEKSFAPSTIEEVAIIGGGIAGCFTAWELAKRGYRIHLICSDNALAEQASGNRQGALYPLLNGSYDTLANFYSHGYRYALQSIKELIEQYGEIAHQWCGVLHISSNPKLAQKHQALAQADYPASLLQPVTATQASAIAGIPLNHEGIFYPEGGWVCPGDLCRAIKLDRFSRKRYDSVLYKAQLEKYGVKLISVTERIGNSPEAKMLEGMLEIVAQFYSDNLGQEVMKGMKENAYKCQHTGGSPALGYKVGADKKYIIDKSEAIIVRTIFDLYINGYGYKAICQKLNDKGWRSKIGNPFTTGSVRTILTNERYTGTYIFNLTASQTIDGKRSSSRQKDESEVIRIEGGMPAIISKKTYQQAENRRKRRMLISNNGKTQEMYLLQGLVKCGVCGARYEGDRAKRKGESVYLSYRCGRRRRKGECSNKAIRKEYLEGFVLEQIEQYWLSNDMIPVMVQYINQQYQEQAKQNQIEIKQLEKQIRELDRKLGNLVLAMADRGYIEEAFQHMESFREDKKIAKKRMEELKQQTIPSITSDIVGRFFKQAKAFIQDRKMNECKALVQTLVEAVIIHNTYIEVTFKIPVIGTKQIQSVS